MELLDVYDNNGNRTGRVIDRSDFKTNPNLLGENENIAVAIIIIENSNHEFLIQKVPRGVYSSTGGHVASKEEPYDTIIREIKEELGYDASNDNIIYKGNKILFDVIRHMYYLNKDIDLSKLKLQKEEVESVEYMDIDKISKLIEEDKFMKGHALVFKELKLIK